MYPAGQADADVTTHVAARIVVSSWKILIVRMAFLLIIPTGTALLSITRIRNEVLYLVV
jgi:hypothetical protein